MNLKEIKEMINLMNENGLTELEIEKDGTRIKLRKGSSQSGDLNSPVIVEKEQVLPRAQESQAAAKEAGKLAEIKSPMVGTFYRAPSPESAPFVNAGDAIEPGQVICIIEAMKLMNEIKAEVRGRIKEVLVDNAEPVEFGQPVFLIEPL
ncbi:MAG: acetyl-CoA carboxylase biotin carboxyl carrier protein [Candidatus Omnitrophica bacterium]|nr:acetyl-CoA carboxylase biotin carboxyl carrier protein [Candidatus Omnitrophota bacterium]